jgi:hypothetical protein
MLGDRRRRMILANISKREYVDFSRVHGIMRKGFLDVLWGAEWAPVCSGWWLGDHVVVLTPHNGDLYSLVLREYRDITDEVFDALEPGGVPMY